MLFEALQYLTTPCPRPFRAMGYLRELIATEARAKRCRAAWQPHLQKSRAVIGEAVAATDGTGKAVVLGAGLLSDIPLNVLAAKFDHVMLVDVCFLKQTRRIVWRHPHIELRVSDITGAARPLHKGERPAAVVPDELTLADADLVVSANVLSQLPLIPVQYLRKSQPHVSEDELHTFAQGIVRAHLAFLETCLGTVCLISEVERQFVDGGHILETEDPLWGVPLDLEGEEWFWNIAPRPEVSPDVDIRNRVKAMVWQSKHPLT